MELLLRLCKSYVVSAAAFALLSVCVAIVITFSEVSIKIGTILICAVLTTVTFVFGMKTAATFGGKGMIVGFASGIFFVIIFIFLAETALNMPLVSALENYMLGIPIFFSCIGGIVGVNVKK